MNFKEWYCNCAANAALNFLFIIPYIPLLLLARQPSLLTSGVTGVSRPVDSEGAAMMFVISAGSFFKLITVYIVSLDSLIGSVCDLPTIDRYKSCVLGLSQPLCELLSCQLVRVTTYCANWVKWCTRVMSFKQFSEKK